MFGKIYQVISFKISDKTSIRFEKIAQSQNARFFEYIQKILAESQDGFCAGKIASGFQKE